MPWIVAKENNLFLKNGVDVDMIFVGVSTVMIQSMLSGSADIAGLGGPAVISNVLRGGDIIQVAATVPAMDGAAAGTDEFGRCQGLCKARQPALFSTTASWKN
jgi:ABC-type nitrate/sulfonate/bicarbonate transport system substrate-binding protein